MTSLPTLSAEDTFSDLAEGRKMPGFHADKVEAGKRLLDGLQSAASKARIPAKLDPNSNDLALIFDFGTGMAPYRVIVLVNEQQGGVHVYNPAVGTPGQPLPLRFSRHDKQYTSPNRFVAADGTARWESALDYIAFAVSGLVVK